ncbi:hypothetical protein MKEN_01298600 [Mycena kentingensis (nom. inval.)]|nr:hypothetical protein MKEN_01298600 [Mycena kentingensis (nom. inval.)]
MSESQLKLWLWILKECGVKDVPSLKAFRKFQESLRKSDSGVSTKECTSPKGNLFYVNDIHKIIANDWGNPHTRRRIHIYPEIPADGIVREMWHAEKWRKSMDRSKLSPMWSGPDSQHYYVDEIAQLNSGKLFIPLRWMKQYTNDVVDGNLSREEAALGFVVAEGYFVRLNGGRVLTVLDDAEPVRVQANMFSNCFVNLERKLSSFSWSDASTQAGYSKKMPNPKRAKARGRPYYCALIIFFGDDVSGNRSKSWNKHLVAEITHANLDRELLQQTAHIHHISCSQHASVAEQFAEIQRAIASSEAAPFPVFDALLHQEACVEIAVFVDASDNPMQSEISNHMGGPANFKCRECEVGGTQEEKRTDKVYHELFFGGVPRSWQGVLSIVGEHLSWACEGKKGLIDAAQTGTGVKDPHAQFWIDKLLSDFKTKTEALRNTSPRRPVCEIKEEVTLELEGWVEDHYSDIINPFFLVKGHDPTQDTPVEILHTILLGIDKYIWYYSYRDWNPAKKELFSQRLQATDANGLSLPPIRASYIMQYAGSLIGRQLKTVIQTAVFHLHDLVDDDHYATWRAVAQLAALLWVPEIDDVDQYCAVKFNFNAQHACYEGKCAPTGTRRVRQERQLTELTEAVLEHTDDDRFIINTSAFHNAHLIRRVLPGLTRPVPWFDTAEERERFHHAQAAKLRASEGQKRKERDGVAAQKKATAAAAQVEAQRLVAEAEAAERAEAEEERPAQRRRVDSEAADMQVD